MVWIQIHMPHMRSGTLGWMKEVTENGKTSHFFLHRTDTVLDGICQSRQDKYALLRTRSARVFVYYRICTISNMSLENKKRVIWQLPPYTDGKPYMRLVSKKIETPNFVSDRKPFRVRECR